MERDSLGTYPAALAAVRTSSGHMERADQMEHLLLKGVRVGLLGGVEAVAVEHALVAAAGRAHVPAGVAADALGELALPEGKTLVRAHGLQLLHLGETVLGLHRKLRVRADQLVVHLSLIHI